MTNPLISIGESIHASIPKTGRIMKQLAQLGPNAYSVPSGPLNYIKVLIESQVSEGADYIAVNLDAFGEADPQITVDMMLEYVRLVRKWGGDVPICTVEHQVLKCLFRGVKAFIRAHFFFLPWVTVRLIRKIYFFRDSNLWTTC